mgnify:CR=1 FL=1
MEFVLLHTLAGRAGLGRDVKNTNGPGRAGPGGPRAGPGRAVKEKKRNGPGRAGPDRARAGPGHGIQARAGLYFQ